MNNGIEKTLELSELFQTYKELLTDKQKEYFELYYNEDLSLQEIADELKVSKNAVHDSLKKTINILEDFENKISVVQLKRDVKNALDGDQEAIEKIRELI